MRNILKGIGWFILTVGLGAGSVIAGKELEQMIAIAIEGKDRYYQSRYLPYTDDDDRYHEPIGDGVYAIWPTKEMYDNRHKGS